MLRCTGRGRLVARRRRRGAPPPDSGTCRPDVSSAPILPGSTGNGAVSGSPCRDCTPSRHGTERRWQAAQLTGQEMCHAGHGGGTQPGAVPCRVSGGERDASAVTAARFRATAHYGAITPALSCYVSLLFYASIEFLPSGVAFPGWLRGAGHGWTTVVGQQVDRRPVNRTKSPPQRRPAATLSHPAGPLTPSKQVFQARGRAEGNSPANRGGKLINDACYQGDEFVFSTATC